MDIDDGFDILKRGNEEWLLAAIGSKKVPVVWDSLHLVVAGPTTGQTRTGAAA